jgi:putative SOS response-associated peptidase YedK
VCGRYTLTKSAKKLGRQLGLELPDFPARYNIAPTQHAPVLLLDGVMQCRMLRWGLVPSWARDLAMGSQLINARSESAAGTRSFRMAFRQRRCLVLADGFYEWRKAGRERFPEWISLADEEPFAFAGLWEQWVAPDGSEHGTYTILTTRANALTERLHHRMPVILKPDDYEAWLDLEAPEIALVRLFEPFPEDRMQMRPVSTAVNNANHEGPDCLSPYQPRQMELF